MYKYMENIFGKRMKELRKEMGLSQKEFAEKLFLSQTTLSSYENQNKMPSTDVILKICDMCHVSADWLLGRSDAKNMDIRTYKDFFRALVEMYQAQKEDNEGLKIRFDAGKAEITIDHPMMVHYMEGYLKLSKLVDQGILDQELIDEWGKKYLDTFDSLLINK